MDPSEQNTGTRDEHYNLISVLYHALHGAENCNTYALDAEAAGDERLTAFFREVGVMQARLAERAKGMLGIVEVRPESAAPSRAGEGSPPPTADVPRTPSDVWHLDERAKPPSSGALSDLVLPEEDIVASEEVPTDTSQEEIGHITPEDFDPTISALEGGVAQLEIGRALAEIETWERKLEATDDAELQSIAGNLGALRGILSSDDIDVTGTGALLTALGEQVRGVASGEVGMQVADKLRRLGELLIREGRSLSA